jgi:hypothetical protein
MKTITKSFKTMRQAEQYQGRLYDKYSGVKLVSFPRFDEAGQYVWQVN